MKNYLFVMALVFGMTAALSAQTPTAGGCNIFPADNVWNTRIDNLPVASNSSGYIATEGGSATALHPDFGTVYDGEPNGWPFVIVPASQPDVAIVFTLYPTESDPGPYPVPPDAPIEGGPQGTGDRHVLVLQSGTCELFEMYYAFPQTDGSWQAGSGAVFNLNADGPLRPLNWTSADAAGLPIFPGLVRYDEVQQALSADGVLHHALRFCTANTQEAFVWPARHYASTNTNPAVPPMGQRFRLKASTNIQVYPGTSTSVSPTNQVILETLQTYGMFLADNCSGLFVSGAPDPRWDDGDLHLLTYYTAENFEAVDESSLTVDPNSGQAAQPLSLIAPANSANAAGSVTVSAQAGPYTNLTQVQFLLDGNNLGAAVGGNGPQYSTVWDSTSVVNGAHTIAATGTDALGNTKVALPITVNVNNAPGVPLGLTATLSLSSQIGLSWSAPSGIVPAVGYTVFRNGVAVGSTANPMFVDNGLTSGTTYSYSVAAYNATGVSSVQSDVISATTGSAVLPPWGIFNE